MQVLFSAPLGVYSFDFSRGMLCGIASGEPEYYGISANAAGLITSHSGLDCEKLTPDDYQSRTPGWLSTASEGAVIQTKAALLAPHQVEAVGDTVVCANTGRNCITLFDRAGHIRELYPTRFRTDVEPDGRKHNHFNSVHVKDGQLFAVTHNYHRLSTVWVWKWPELELMDVVGTKAEWAHNVWAREDDLVVCNSRAGALYSTREKTDIWRQTAGGFITRGLAVWENYIIVGLSAIASRGDRKNSDSGLAIIDRNTLQTLDTRIFPGLGAVHEVRLAGHRDECHGGNIIQLPTSRGAKKSAAATRLCGVARKLGAVAMGR